MPYPQDEHFFSITVDNEKLGVFGEGFPVFFYLIKYMTILILILTVFFFFPTLFYMVEAYDRVEA